MTVLLMMAAGAVGAVARSSADLAIQRRGNGGYPWGTFWVNISGCLLLGLVVGWVDHHGGHRLQTIAGTGFCGAYTTFSTFSVESVGLLQSRRYGPAARYVLTSVIAGGIAAAAGLAIAR